MNNALNEFRKAMLLRIRVEGLDAAVLAHQRPSIHIQFPYNKIGVSIEVVGALLCW